MRALQLTLLIAVAAFATGCASVKPWEKGRLASYAMRPDRDPLTASISEHVWFTREAFSGGRSIGGGGCGCN
jgi:hypothetical protein